jgi:hypothetical protein
LARNYTGNVVKHSKAESCVRAKAERGKELSRRTDFEEEGRFVGWVGFLSEDGEVAIGMEALNEARAGRGWDAQALSADGNASVRAHSDGGALAPDVGPPGTVGGFAQRHASLPFGQSGGGIGGAGEFAVDFVSVAMAAQLVQERVGLLGGGDALGSEEAGEAALPVKMLAFDLALGLGGAGIAEAHAVEVERGAQLSEGLGALREEETVAVDIEFEG